MSATGLGGRAARGVAWNYATFVVSKALALATTAILARLLSPDDFGLMALGLLVLTYLDHLNDGGVAQAVIYRRDRVEQTTDVAFTIGLTISVGLGAVLLIGAPLLAGFFGEPELTGILRVLAIAFVISGVRVVPEARLKRSLAFRRRVVPETVKAVVKGATAVVLALLGHGVWSLVWGQLAGSAVSTVLYWHAAGLRPHFAYDPDVARRLLSYGVPMVLVGLLGAAVKNVDYVVVGRRMDAAALGLYTMAFRLPQLIVLSVTRVVSDVLFPVFAAQQHDRAALRRGYLRSLGYVATLTLPVGVGLALVAEPAIVVLFSAKWLPAVPLLRRLALYAAVLTLGFTIGDVYKGIGRPWLINLLGVVKLAVSVPVLWIAAGGTLTDVTNALLGVVVALVLVEMAVAARVLELTAPDFVGVLWRPALLTAAMAAVVMGVLRALPAGAPLLQLVGATACGAAAYGLSLLVLDRQIVDDLVRLRGRRPRDRAGRREDGDHARP